MALDHALGSGNRFQKWLSVSVVLAIGQLIPDPYARFSRSSTRYPTAEEF